MQTIIMRTCIPKRFGACFSFFKSVCLKIFTIGKWEITSLFRREFFARQQHAVVTLFL